MTEGNASHVPGLDHWDTQSRRQLDGVYSSLKSSLTPLTEIAEVAWRIVTPVEQFPRGYASFFRPMFRDDGLDFHQSWRARLGVDQRGDGGGQFGVGGLFSHNNLSYR